MNNIKQAVYLGQHIVYQHAVNTLLANSSAPVTALVGMFEWVGSNFEMSMAQSLQAQRH